MHLAMRPTPCTIGQVHLLVFHNYNNNESKSIQSYTAIFADDTKLYRPIITADDSNIPRLKSDLDLLI